MQSCEKDCLREEYKKSRYRVEITYTEAQCPKLRAQTKRYRIKVKVIPPLVANTFAFAKDSSLEMRPSPFAQGENRGICKGFCTYIKQVLLLDGIGCQRISTFGLIYSVRLWP
jgi:hypothetical protein